ncbi:hypothetical protein VFPFJ_03208 [Purpureocillium lilacinum]|uniref:Uncharacterized protein n=1 Tax=Purpureocillium lilacinum TaxID=33203 RepID=A0A179HP64_PURLI|nr:hypothetical protein VFPFJ_03208 [Purpureocillium lilacinum]OAQ91468.1 hypothetical protein VFPFJ_03208 [Purpureocillium lilacinum]
MPPTRQACHAVRRAVLYRATTPTRPTSLHPPYRPEAGRRELRSLHHLGPCHLASSSSSSSRGLPAVRRKRKRRDPARPLLQPARIFQGPLFPSRRAHWSAPPRTPSVHSIPTREPRPTAHLPRTRPGSLS